MTPNLRRSGVSRFRDLALRPAGTSPVFRRHHASPAVTIWTWRCAGHAAHPEEELAERWEVVVPRRGAFEWEIEGARTLADPATATLLHPGQPYRVRHPLGGGDAGTVFALGPADARALLAAHDPAAAERQAVRFPRFTVALDGPLYLLHRLALHAAADRSAGSLEVEERAAAFLHAVVARAYTWAPPRRGARPVSPRSAELVALVVEEVARRYREPLSLGGIAAVAGVSRWHLSRAVTAVMGVPIYRLVLRRRLRDALELLLETRETLARIAVTVGFASHSHLTEAFRREFGMVPSALRARRR